MKLVKRILLVLSAVTAVLGIGCVISGFILEGGIRPAVQNLAEEFERGWERITHPLRGDWAEGETGNRWDPASEPEYATSRYAAAEKLEIDVGYGSVVLLNGEGEDIVVRARNVSAENYSARKEGDTLKIKDTSRRHKKSGDPYIEIQIPEGHRFETAELEIGAGVLTADVIRAEEFQAKIGSGRMEVTGALYTDEAECSAGAGEIQVALLDARELKLECAVGSAAVTLAGTEADYSLEAACGVGTIVFGENTYTSMKKSRVQEGKDREIEAECGVGTILLQFEEA